MGEMKPTVKLVAYPLIFVVWCVYRLSTVTYVDSPSFYEYWDEL